MVFVGQTTDPLDVPIKQSVKVMEILGCDQWQEVQDNGIHGNLSESM